MIEAVVCPTSAALLLANLVKLVMQIARDTLQR